jgi:transportin-3
LQFIDINIPESETHPSVTFLQQLWPVFERIFDKHGLRNVTAESLSRFFRHIMDSTQLFFYPILAPMMNLVVAAFEKCVLSCYIWLCAKCVRIFGQNINFKNEVCQLIERITQTVFNAVQNTQISYEEPELGKVLFNSVIEEYHYMLSTFIDASPASFLDSPLLSSTFQCAVYCLNSQTEISVNSVLRYIIDIFELANQTKSSVSSKATPLVIGLLEQQGSSLVQNVLKGLIYTFSRDRVIITDCAELFLGLSVIIGTANTMQLVKSSVCNFPEKEMSNELKTAFLIKVQE